MSDKELATRRNSFPGRVDIKCKGPRFHKLRACSKGNEDAEDKTAEMENIRRY